MATAVPVWTDAVSVVAAQVLARGSTVRGTLDLRANYGAHLFCKIGRGGTAVLTNGVDLLVRRVLNNDTAMAGGAHPVGGIGLLSTTAAAVVTTCATSDSTAGSPTLNVASIGAIVAGQFICIQDSGGGVTRLEWHRISKVATGVLTLDRNLQFTHTTAQADTVRSSADVFAPMWLPGGSLWECVYDFGDDSAGDSVTVQAVAQVWTSETIT